MTRSGWPGKRLFDFHVADNNRFAAGLGHIDWKKHRRDPARRSAMTAR